LEILYDILTMAAAFSAAHYTFHTTVPEEFKEFASEHLNVPVNKIDTIGAMQVLERIVETDIPEDQFVRDNEKILIGEYRIYNNKEYLDTLKVKYSAEQGAKKIKSMLKTPKKKRDKDYYLELLSMYKAAELTDEQTKGSLEKYQKESMGFLTNDEISKITPAVFDYKPMDPAKRLDQTEILEIIHNESLIEMQKRVLKIR